MLEQSEDEIDIRLRPPSIDKSPASFEKDAVNRVVYKLVRVGDDGSVLPATEDEVMQVQSLVGGESILEPSDADASDANEYEAEDEGSEDEQDSNADENDEKENASFSEPEDVEVKRKKLLTHLKVLDTVLSELKAEEEQRIGLEGLGDGVGQESPFLLANYGSGEYKRQRRPNPKYTDSGDELSIPANARVAGGEIVVAPVLPEKQSPQPPSVNPGSYGSTPGMSLRSFRSSSHRTRMTRILPPYSKLDGSSAAAAAAIKSSLDNLSIRELHATFRKTFNRETSVKDKLWLKRQIAMGLHNHTEATESGANSIDNSQDANMKVRLEKFSSAEVPLPTAAPPNGRAGASDFADGAHALGFGSLDGDEPENKRPIRKTVPLSVVSPTGPLDASTTAGLGSSVDANSVFSQVDNNSGLSGQSGGKRQRKPNRRYIEDETEDLAAYLNGSRPASGFSELVPGQGMTKPSIRPWNISDGPADSTRQSSLRSSSLARGSPLVPQVSNAKHNNHAVKRKVEDRAAKLVKIAHSVRASRQEADNTVRKVKFRVPPASGQDEDDLSEFNGLAEDQVTCLLPTASDNRPDDMQDLLMSDNRHEETNEPVATVPTANGGTRRKHHRPWTPREVMTLVEGVARCGGGKWADIKKLAFATAGHRTAVDLKDKWRNLLRASRVQLHPPKQGERKKQFTASIPAPILARVRELAALQNQASATVSSGTSRSGRAVHRK